MNKEKNWIEKKEVVGKKWTGVKEGKEREGEEEEKEKKSGRSEKGIEKDERCGRLLYFWEWPYGWMILLRKEKG